MALEEGLNVKLVLLPDREDPDSYVNKIGSTAFKEFVASSKKDFILFQLEIALGEAGNDSAKKAAIVNQIAETISKINKAEDFTRQQDYIRRSSEIMRIDESGLNNLVNQFTRERISKLENKQAAEEKKHIENTEAAEESNFDDSTFKLLYKDELQERGLVKALIEFGDHKWTDDKKLADYIFEEAIDIDLFENDELRKIFESYKSMYTAGHQPLTRDFIHSPDLAVSTLIISITNFPYELSPVWKEEHTDAKFKDEVKTQKDYYSFKDMILTREGQIKTSAFKDEKDEFEMRYVFDAVLYLKIKKIKKLIYENQKDIELLHTDEEQQMLMQTHQHLKKMEMETLKKKQTVYLGK
jgi:DNA primase